MLIKSITLWVLALLCIGYADPDTRYRSYGSVQFYGQPLPFRTAHGNVENADFIVVGKLDGNTTAGPFKDLSHSEILKRWSLLRQASPHSHPGGFTPNSTLEFYFPWAQNYSEETYKLAIRTITGQSSPYYYMKDVLNAQYIAETSVIPEIGMSWLRKWVVEKADELDGQGVTNPTIYFEVGNEPNAYPAIPPRLYAWYYMKYRGAISSTIHQINNSPGGRASQGKPLLTFKMMPGGILLMDGFPSNVRSALNEGFRATAAGIDLDARMYADAVEYWQSFIYYLNKPIYIIRKPDFVYPPGKVTRIYDYDGYAGFSQISYKYYNSNGQEVSQTSYNNANSGVWYKLPASWQSKPISELVELGNLHFYPYRGIHSPSSLTSQISNLQSIAQSIASYTTHSEVWLTEVGNLTSLTEQTVVSDILIPIMNHLGSQSTITRWYWYKNFGADPKFALLQSLPSSASSTEIFAAFFGAFTYQTLAVLLSSMPGFYVPPISGSASGTIGDILYEWKNNNPPQVLTQENSGGLTLIGQAYANKAGYKPKFEPSFLIPLLD